MADRPRQGTKLLAIPFMLGSLAFAFIPPGEAGLAVGALLIGVVFLVWPSTGASS